LLVPVRDIARKTIHQRAQVLATLAQARNRQRGAGDPVEQIGAKSAGAHLVAQALIAGRDQTKLDAPRPRAAERVHLSALQHAQQIRLQIHRHLRDLIEKQSAAAGALNLADHAGAPGTGEGTLDVAEEFARQKLARQAATVERNERGLRVRAARVNGARKDLLSDTGLPLQQERRVDPREPPSPIYRLT